jgi:hypothetical protein
MEPVRVTEGLMLLTINRGGIFMSGRPWKIFHRMFPSASFNEF